MLAFAFVIDLRSDTVTRPTPAMRRAMAEAEVGDDVYAEDPTVNRLQEAAAERLGFEAALFVPTGVMANEIAIRLLTSPGQEVLAEERSHVVQFELAGMAVLSGVLPRVVRSEPASSPPPRSSPPSARPPTTAPTWPWRSSRTRTTWRGVRWRASRPPLLPGRLPQAGLKTHLDGARLWNAAVALGIEARELAAGFDTVIVTLSKGLCAPAGSLLFSSAARVQEARRVRKLLGGGMRQVGVLAAAGLVALETMVDRLADDHAHARLLGGGPGRVSRSRGAAGPDQHRGGVPGARSALDTVAALEARGVRASVMDARTLRLVTHHDVTRADCERAAATLAQLLG